ncbi:protein amalgam-like [Amphibalanus amphitrite]|uniref:protein amalgam-like n=1 Tax=Amphibalanus amphitrite TaxID=1232801 RepID=UPI001C911304|nr:protein amalgam-like [Amphibalanus amphitrite]
MAVVGSAAVILTVLSALQPRGLASRTGYSYDYPTYDRPDTLYPPQFLSVSGQHTVRQGNSTVLPCAVQDLGARMVMWKKQRQILTVKSQVFAEQERSRLRLVDGFNLQISRATPSDAGVYTCTVALNDRDLEQTQTLDVHYGPTLHTVPESGLVIAEQGQNATLECHATGNPKPRVKWRKKVDGSSAVVDLVGGEVLSLESVTRSDAGTIECYADNPVGDSASVLLTLQVLYPPEVEVERSTIFTGEGFTAQLVCLVHADPPAEVTWTRSGSPIDFDRISQTNDVIMSSRHVLTIEEVTLDDFDTYTCNATNQLGSSHGKIYVSGEADKVEITSAPMGGDVDSYDLAWKVKSFSPIIEYKIAYRKTKVNSTSQGAGPWTTLTAPTTGRQPVADIHFEQRVTLRHLTPATAYDLRIQAQNKHGWNRVSDTFHFSTIGREVS